MTALRVDGRLDNGTKVTITFLEAGDFFVILSENGLVLRNHRKEYRIIHSEKYLERKKGRERKGREERNVEGEGGRKGKVWADEAKCKPLTFLCRQLYESSLYVFETLKTYPLSHCNSIHCTYVFTS